MAAKRTVIVSGGHTWHKISVQQPNWPSLHTNKPRLAPLSDQCPRQPLSPFLCTRSQFLPFLSYSNLPELPSADPISDYELNFPSCMHWIQLSDFLCPSHGCQPAPLRGSDDRLIWLAGFGQCSEHCCGDGAGDSLSWVLPNFSIEKYWVSPCENVWNGWRNRDQTSLRNTLTVWHPHASLVAYANLSVVMAAWSAHPSCVD